MNSMAEELRSKEKALQEQAHRYDAKEKELLNQRSISSKLEMDLKQALDCIEKLKEKSNETKKGL